MSSLYLVDRFSAHPSKVVRSSTAGTTCQPAIAGCGGGDVLTIRQESANTLAMLAMDKTRQLGHLHSGTSLRLSCCSPSEDRDVKNMSMSLTYLSI